MKFRSLGFQGAGCQGFGFRLSGNQGAVRRRRFCAARAMKAESPEETPSPHPKPPCSLWGAGTCRFWGFRAFRWLQRFSGFGL